MALLIESRGAARARARHIVGTCLVGVALLLGWGRGLLGQTARASEYQVKAVLLFKVAQFVDWPAGAFADSAAPFVIGVLGDDPFGPYLDDAIRGETVGGRPLEVRRYHRVEDIRACHILFISASEAGRLDAIVRDLKDRAVLTVGDEPGTAQRGAMIRLIADRSRIRVRINLQATEAAQLRVSSKLLRVAEIVTPGKP